MHISRTTVSDTEVKLTITADQKQIDNTKERIITQLGRDIKVQGFRAGKAPSHLVERQLDQSRFQSEFLETIVNELYMIAVQKENLRPTKAPDISITKFVPFTTLEFTADLEVIGAIKLPDYKKLSLDRPTVKVVAKDIDDVLSNLRTRAAAKEEVTRASKLGDQVTIDFKGVDSKTKELIDGADGKDYALVLGSKTFIPGFEEELVGLKPKDDKTFPLIFPKDYGVDSLKSRKVEFSIIVHKVEKLVEPKLDDAFAATVGPFKTLDELRGDIKKQLEAERQQQARSDYNNTLLEKLAQQTTVALPISVIEAEIDRIEDEERNNLVYRGQTWQEHLDNEGLTAEAHRDKNRAGAELRVKAGIILSEVAEQEGISVTPEEVDIQMQLLRGRYGTDDAMQAELDKPERRRDIGSRLLSEKTIDKLAEYATAKKK